MSTYVCGYLFGSTLATRHSWETGGGMLGGARGAVCVGGAKLSSRQA